MITINLLPEELRIQPKSERSFSYLKIGAIAGVLFSLLTVYFYIDLLVAGSKLKKLEVSWTKIQPQSAELTKLEEEVEKKLRPEKIFLESFVTAEKSLTLFMVWVSEFLPDGVWLAEFRMERKQDGGHLFLRGLALPSKEKSSIESIEMYLHELKLKIPEANLSLTTTRQTLEERELTQFLADFEWGSKGKP